MLERSRVPRPPHSRSISAGLTLLLCAAALSGCSGTSSADPAPSAPPPPALTTQQQDAAAFESVYAKYIALSPDTETESDLRPLLTGSALTDSVNALNASKATGQRVQGSSSYSRFTVTEYGDKYMVAQVCFDFSGIRVVDKSGSDISDPKSKTTSLQVKAVQEQVGASWRISDIVKNDQVHACA